MDILLAGSRSELAEAHDLQHKCASLCWLAGDAMETVSVFDAKNKLSALLDRVERGEEVTITRRGEAIARLVPTVKTDRTDALVARMQEIRDRIAARGERFTQEEIKAYRDEGRR